MMIKSRFFQSTILCGLAVLLVFGWLATAEDIEVLTGEGLLEVIQESGAVENRPAYVNREQGIEQVKEAEEAFESEVEPEIDIAQEDVFEAEPPRTEVTVDDELLNLIPANSIVVVRVNNLDYTLNMIDQFLAGASPMPMGASMAVRMQLAGMLGDPALSNVDTAGSFAVFVSVANDMQEDGPMANIFIGGLLPLTSFQQFVSGNPNCSEPDEEGISRITSTDMMGQAKSMLLAEAGSFGIISSADSYDKLAQMLRSLGEQASVFASGLEADDIEQATTEAIWAYSNIQLVSDAFGQAIFDGLDQVQTMMETMPAGATSQPDPAAIIDIYACAIKNIMEQTRSVSLTVEPSADVLRISERIVAMEATEMADAFASGPAKGEELELMGFLEDGAAMNFALHADAPLFVKLNDLGVDFMAAIVGEAMAVDATAEMKNIATEMLEAIDGPVAGSFFIDPQSKPPFVVTYAVKIKDVDKYNKAFDKSLLIWNEAGIRDFYESLGLETDFTVNRGFDSYDGVDIDAARFNMTVKDTNTPDGQILEMMYGGGFDYRLAEVDKLGIFAVGGDVDSKIRELIDKAKAGSYDRGGNEVQAALALIPKAQDADFFATVNVIRLMGMFMAISPIPMPAMDIPTSSNIVLAGSAEKGKLTIDVAIPKQHMTEIMTAFIKMQQQMMQQQMEMMQQMEQMQEQPIE